MGTQPCASPDSSRPSFSVCCALQLLLLRLSPHPPFHHRHSGRPTSLDLSCLQRATWWRRPWRRIRSPRQRRPGRRKGPMAGAVVGGWCAVLTRPCLWSACAAFTRVGTARRQRHGTSEGGRVGEEEWRVRRARSMVAERRGIMCRSTESREGDEECAATYIQLSLRFLQPTPLSTSIGVRHLLWPLSSAALLM